MRPCYVWIFISGAGATLLRICQKLTPRRIKRTFLTPPPQRPPAQHGLPFAVSPLRFFFRGWRSVGINFCARSRYFCYLYFGAIGTISAIYFRAVSASDTLGKWKFVTRICFIGGNLLKSFLRWANPRWPQWPKIYFCFTTLLIQFCRQKIEGAPLKCFIYIF